LGGGKTQSQKKAWKFVLSHTSTARYVGRTAYYRDYVFIIVLKCGAALSCFEEVERE
jgi:hypothetical protein